MRTLEDILRFELMFRHYKQCPDDPAYWGRWDSYMEEGYPYKLLEAIQDALERDL